MPAESTLSAVASSENETPALSISETCNDFDLIDLNDSSSEEEPNIVVPSTPPNIQKINTADMKTPSAVLDYIGSPRNTNTESSVLAVSSSPSKTALAVRSYENFIAGEKRGNFAAQDDEVKETTSSYLTDRRRMVVQPASSDQLSHASSQQLEPTKQAAQNSQNVVRPPLSSNPIYVAPLADPLYHPVKSSGYGLESELGIIHYNQAVRKAREEKDITESDMDEIHTDRNGQVLKWIAKSKRYIPITRNYPEPAARDSYQNTNQGNFSRNEQREEQQRRRHRHQPYAGSYYPQAEAVRQHSNAEPRTVNELLSTQYRHDVPHENRRGGGRVHRGGRSGRIGRGNNNFNGRGGYRGRGEFRGGRARGRGMRKASTRGALIDITEERRTSTEVKYPEDEGGAGHVLPGFPSLI